MNKFGIITTSNKHTFNSGVTLIKTACKNLTDAINKKKMNDFVEKKISSKYYISVLIFQFKCSANSMSVESMQYALMISGNISGYYTAQNKIDLKDMF